MNLSSTFKLRNFDIRNEDDDGSTTPLIYTYLIQSKVLDIINLVWAIVLSIPKVMRRPECRIKQISSHTIFFLLTAFFGELDRQKNELSMKKIFSIIATTFLSTVAYSQLPLVDYKPVYVPQRATQPVRRPNIPSYSVPDIPYQQGKQSKLQTVAAYFWDSTLEKFKRTKIKICLIEAFNGGYDIYVRAMLDRSSYKDYWKECNDIATKVRPQLDPELIVDNFEWKIENVTLGSSQGKLYFNY